MFLRQIPLKDQKDQNKQATRSIPNFAKRVIYENLKVPLDNHTCELLTVAARGHFYTNFM